MRSGVEFEVLLQKWKGWLHKAGSQAVHAARNWRDTLATTRNLLLTGVVVAIPIIATGWVLKIAYGIINGVSAWFLEAWFGRTPPTGLGFVVTLLLLIFLGFMATNVLGQRILDWAEKQLLRVPLVATIYNGVKQVIDSFKSFNNMANFKRVVYVEYPSPGCKLIGLVTGQYFDSKLGHELVSVVIPTAPNPMTGLVIVVEASQVIESELSLEEAMKLIVSAGLVSPKRKSTPVPPPPPLVVE